MLEIAIIKSEVETWGIIFDKFCQIMAYADEVVIRGRMFKRSNYVLYSFFWAIPRCLNFMCQRFGTLSVPTS